MSDIGIDILKKMPLFEGLDNNAIIEVSKYISERHFNNGETIFRAGDENDLLYIVKSGHLKVSVTGSDGQEVFQSTLSAGAFFGEMSLLTGDCVSADVAAIIDSELYAIHLNDFNKIIRSYSSVSVKIGHILSQRLKATNLGFGREQEEARLSAVIGPADHLDTIVHYSTLVAKSISGTFGKRVLLVVLEPDFPLERIAEFVRTVPQRAETDGIFNMYRINSTLDIGILKGDAGAKLQEKAAQLMGSYIPQYGHIIGISHAGREPHKCRFLYYSKRTITICPDTILTENYDTEMIERLSGKEKAVTVFADQEMTAKRKRHTVRRFFKGPIFTCSADTINNDKSAEIARAARFLENKSLGIVFGAGGARGFAHIGVMKVLEKNGLEPDVYCGSSMGAIVASLFEKWRGLCTEMLRSMI
jgi:CRP-like cAMP-binding protein